MLTNRRQNRMPATNSTYPKVAIQWLNQALCIYQSFCLIDSEVLRNLPLRQAPKRFLQAQRRKPNERNDQRNNEYKTRNHTDKYCWTSQFFLFYRDNFCLRNQRQHNTDIITLSNFNSVDNIGYSKYPTWILPDNFNVIDLFDFTNQ